MTEEVHQTKLKRPERTRGWPSRETGSDPNMAAIAGLHIKHGQALAEDFKTSISLFEAKLDHIHWLTPQRLPCWSLMLTCKMNIC